MEQLRTLATVSLVGALGLVTLLFIMKYRSHLKTRGKSLRTHKAPSPPDDGSKYVARKS